MDTAQSSDLAFLNHFKIKESVTEGLPNEMCDQNSDVVQEAFLKDDPESRVA